MYNIKLTFLWILVTKDVKQREASRQGSLAALLVKLSNKRLFNQLTRQLTEELDQYATYTELSAQTTTPWGHAQIPIYFSSLRLLGQIRRRKSRTFGSTSLICINSSHDRKNIFSVNLTYLFQLIASRIFNHLMMLK